jgi:serine/threonine protein kinase
MFKLFSAMEYVHMQGVAHRDLKPENLLLSSEDTFDVKIIDFGLSKKFRDDRLKAKSSQVGTPLYVAPEVLDGKYNLILQVGSHWNVITGPWGVSCTYYSAARPPFSLRIS